jgi:hypothetical protein
MQSFYSSKRTFIIEAHDNGDVWLFRGFPAKGLLVCSDDELIELFGLICTYITEQLIPGWNWLVSDDHRETDDNGHSEDDVPF